MAAIGRNSPNDCGGFTPMRFGWRLRDSLSEAEHDSKLVCLHGRMIDLAVADWSNPHAQRLAKRLFKYGDQLLTFVEVEGVPSDNNHAERQIRPAVLMCKASYGNQSTRGARTRAILMTIYRTLKKARSRTPPGNAQCLANLFANRPIAPSSR